MLARVMSFSRPHLPRILLHISIYALMLLMPLSAHWRIGEPVVDGVLPLYATPVLYVADPAVAGVLLLGLIHRRQRPHWSRERAVPLFTLAVLALATAPLGIEPGFAGYTALRWLAAIGIFWMLAQTDLDREGVLSWFLLGLGVQAVIGIGQVLRQGPLGLPGELTVPPQQSGSAVVILEETRFLRAYGMTFHPNVLGGFLVVGLLAAMQFLVKPYMRLLWWLLFVGLLLSFSRSAWLAVLLILPPTALWLFRREPGLRRPIAITLTGAGLIVILGVFFLGEPIITRLSPTEPLSEQPSVAERLELASVAIQTIQAHPLTGVGAGDFPIEVAVNHPAQRPEPVHNVPLLLAAEIGLAGGALWLWLWLGGGVGLFRHWRVLPVWVLLLGGGWVALGVISLLDSYPWSLNAGLLLTVSILGLADGSLSEAHDISG